MAATSSRHVVRGACGHDCPDSCGWVVETDGDVAVKLSGNPDHPFTRGALCAKVNHYLEKVYHPDRVLHPLNPTAVSTNPRIIRDGIPRTIGGQSTTRPLRPTKKRQAREPWTADRSSLRAHIPRG